TARCRPSGCGSSGRPCNGRGSCGCSSCRSTSSRSSARRPWREHCRLRQRGRVIVILPMDRRAAWVLGIVFGGMFISLFGFLLVLYLAVKSDGEGGGSRGGGEDRVGVVEVSGTIMESKRTLKELNHFADEEHIKA